MFKSMLLLLSLTVTFSTAFFMIADSHIAAANSTNQTTKLTSHSYTLNLKTFNVSNKGTNPIETTKGINEALKWAHDKGYTTFKLPEGTYLIDKNSQLNMVGDMTFLLDNKTTIKKETNGLSGYKIMNIGYNANHVTLDGGNYVGDRNQHDYWNGAQTWQPHTVYKVGDLIKPTFARAKDWGYYYKVIQAGTSGTTEPSWFWTKNSTDDHVVYQPIKRNTNESGDGIILSGAQDVVIENVNANSFTGDGLDVGGANLYFKDLYENSFEDGSINSNGKKVSNSSTIRLKNNVSLSDPSFKETKTLVIDNPKKLNWHFDIYFYDALGNFLSVQKNDKRGDILAIPTGADSFNLVYHQPSFNGTYVEVWNKVQAKNVDVKQSTFDHNRRNGITVGGGDHVTIENNQITYTGGIPPMAGIDVEGGYGNDGMVNSHITVKGNEFHANQRYDLILYDGHNGLVENNKFSWANVAVSPPFTNATLKDNSFNHGELYAYHDVHLIGNTMSHGVTHLEGPNLTVDGMTFKDNSHFEVSSAQPFGVKISNITMYNSNFGTWVEPVTVNNMTIHGGSIGGSGKPGSTFNDVKLLDNTGTDLPSGIYTNCVFQAATNNHTDGPHSVITGEYTFNNCQFIGNGLDIGGNNSKLTIKYSTFNILQNSGAIEVGAASLVDLENNKLTALKQQPNKWGQPMSVIQINGYWKKAQPTKVSNVTIKNNTIVSSANDSRGISTIFAGVGAKPYTIEGNKLYTAKLALKSNDIVENNHVFIKKNGKWASTN